MNIVLTNIRRRQSVVYPCPWRLMLKVEMYRLSSEWEVILHASKSAVIIALRNKEGNN